MLKSLKHSNPNVAEYLWLTKMSFEVESDEYHFTIDRSKYYS